MASAKGYVPLSQETGSDAGMSAATTNRRAQCDLCKLSYSTEEELTEHLVSLLHHMKLEHKDKNPIHICTLCHETSTNMDNYRAHIATEKHQMRLCDLRGDDWNYIRRFQPGNKKNQFNFKNKRFNNKRQHYFQTSGDTQVRNSFKKYDKKHNGSTFFRNNQHQNRFYQDSINWPNASRMNSNDGCVNGFRNLMAFGQSVTGSGDMDRRMGHSTAATEESGYKPWGSGVSSRHCNRPTCQGLSRPCVHSSGQAQGGLQSEYADDFTADTMLPTWDEQDLLQQEQFLANFNDAHFVNHQYIYVRPVVSQVARYAPSVASGVARQPSNSSSDRAGHAVAETRFDDFCNRHNGPVGSSEVSSQAQHKDFSGHQTLPSDTNVFKRAGSNTNGFPDRTVFHQSNTSRLHSNQDPFHIDRREQRLSNESTSSSTPQQPQGKEGVILEPNSVQGLDRGPPSESSPCPAVTASSQPGMAGSTLDEIKKSIEKMVVDGEESVQKTLKDIPQSQGKRKRCSSAGVDLENHNKEDLTTTMASSVKRTCKPQLSTDHIKKIINAPYSRDERVQLAKMIQSREEHKTSTHATLRPNLQLEMSHPSASTSQEVSSEKTSESCVQTIKLEDLADSVRSQILSLIGLDVLAYTEGPTKLNIGKKVEGSGKSNNDSKSQSKAIVLSDDELSSQTKKKKIKGSKIKKRPGKEMCASDVSGGKDLLPSVVPSVESPLMTLYKDDRKSKSLPGKERHRSANKEKTSKKFKSHSRLNIEQPMLDAVCVSSPETIIVESQDSGGDHSTVVASKKKSSSVLPQCEPVLVTDSDSDDCTEILAVTSNNLEVLPADVPDVEEAAPPSDTGGRKQVVSTGGSKSSQSPVVDNKAKKVMKSCESKAARQASEGVESANKKSIKDLDKAANSVNEINTKGQTQNKVKDKITDANSEGANNNKKHKRINVVVDEGTGNKKVKDKVTKSADICANDSRKKKKTRDTGIDSANDVAKEDKKNKKRQDKVVDSDSVQITEGKKSKKGKEKIIDPDDGTTKDKKKKRDKKKVVDMASKSDAESCKSKSPSKKHKSRHSTVCPQMDTGQSPEGSTASADEPTAQVSLSDPSGSTVVMPLTCRSTLSTSPVKQPKPSSLQLNTISSSLDQEISTTDSIGAVDSPAAHKTPQTVGAEAVTEETTVFNNTPASSTGSANNIHSLQAFSVNGTRTSPTSQSKSTHTLLTSPSRSICTSPTNSFNKSQTLRSVVLSNTHDSQSGKLNSIQTSQSNLSNTAQTSQSDPSNSVQTSQSDLSNSVQTPQSDSLNSVQRSQSDSSSSTHTLPADAMSTTNTSQRLTLLPSTWLHRSSSTHTNDNVVQASKETLSEPSLTIIDDDETVDLKEREALVQSGELSSHIMSKLLLISESEENVRQEKMSLDLRLSRLYKLVEQAMVQINQCTDRRKQLQEQEQECSKQRLTILREAASMNSSKKAGTNDGVSAATSDLHEQLVVNQHEQSICMSSSGVENSQGSLSKADWLAKFSSYLPQEAATSDHPNAVEKVETSVKMGSAVPAASSSRLTPNKQPAADGNFELPQITDVRGMFTAHNLLFRPTSGMDFHQMGAFSEGRDSREHSEESSQEEGAKSQEEGVNSREGAAVKEGSRLKSTFPQLSRHLLSGPVMYLGSFMSKDTSCSGGTMQSGCVSE